jgi:hypothetical protein
VPRKGFKGLVAKRIFEKKAFFVSVPEVNGNTSVEFERVLWSTFVTDKKTGQQGILTKRDCTAQLLFKVPRCLV